MQNWNIAVTTFSKTPLLDTIHTPDDLRRLLPRLANKAVLTIR